MTTLTHIQRSATTLPLLSSQYDQPLPTSHLLEHSDTMDAQEHRDALMAQLLEARAQVLGRLSEYPQLSIC